MRVSGDARARGECPFSPGASLSTRAPLNLVAGEALHHGVEREGEGEEGRGLTKTKTSTGE